jgi:DNA-binding beta-propeller fold protein YncE
MLGFLDDSVRRPRVGKHFPTLKEKNMRRIAGLVFALLMILGFTAPAAADENSKHDRDNSTLFATGQAGAVLLAIDVESGTTTVIGPTGRPGSLALAITQDGTAAYTVANFRSPMAQLAKIDLSSGAATLVGNPLGGNLQVMGLTFAPDGVLYAAGDFDPISPTFNSLYTIDLNTGAATRVGSLGGSTTADFVMSFAWDSDGHMFGASMTSLYRIHRHRTRNLATKLADFVGSSAVMGIAVAQDGSFYAADFIGPPKLSTIYSVNIETGFLTKLFNTGIAKVHNIAFKPQGELNSHDEND